MSAAVANADVAMSDLPVAVSSSAAVADPSGVTGKVKKPRGPRKAKTTADAASVAPAPKASAAKAGAASAAGSASAPSAAAGAAAAGKRPPTRFDVGNPAHYCNLAAFWTFRRNQRNSLKRTVELLAKHEAALAAARGGKPDSVPAEKIKEWEDEAAHLRDLIARYNATISTLQEHKQEVNTTVEHIYRLGSICSQTSVPVEADTLARDCLASLAKGMTPRPAKLSAAASAADADAE